MLSIGKWLRKYRKKNGNPGQGEDRGRGGVELRSGPHPFDRLLSGTARQARRKRTGKPENTLHTLP